MKKLFFLPFIILGFMANAKNYYISNSGNDANNGSSPATAWATLNKLNSFTSLVAGDSVLFKKGDTFYGQFSISTSGTSSNPIVFSAYGTGVNPVITGFTTVSGWTNLGDNIWESASAISTLSNCNMVAINGVNTPMGRYPNTGFLTFKSHVGKTSITDNFGLSGTPDWTGAELAWFTTTYTIDKCLITSQSGGTLYYSSPKDSTGEVVQRDGLRYIIQNDVRTLDTTNEWYFNPSTKKIRIYSKNSPKNVEVATIDTLIYYGRGTGGMTSYVTFDNIVFTGANGAVFKLRWGNKLTVKNCAFIQNSTGINAPYGYGSAHGDGLVISNNIFDDINNNAISLKGDYINAYIGFNTISHIGLNIGMGNSGGSNSIALYIYGKGSKIEYNTISNVGYIGIQFDGDSTVVNNNFISNALTLKVDGGGIYTWNGKGANRPVFVGRKVLNNIVLNSPTASGIYMDDGTQGVEVAGNTVAGCSRGLLLNGNQQMNVHDNTLYNNEEAQLMLQSYSYGDEFARNDTVTSNILFSKLSTQPTLYFRSQSDDILLFGLIDSNYYARPIDDNVVIYIYPTISGVHKTIKQTLVQWKTYSSQDANSKKSPKTIADVNDLRFEYNVTSSNKIIALDANYIDVKGNYYNGSVTLLPYTSIILIK